MFGMNTLLLLLIIYLVYLLIWLVVNVVVYSISVAFNLPKAYEWLVKLSVAVLYLLNFIIGIGLLWYGVILFLSGQFFWLVLYFFIGISLISTLLSVSQWPFVIITAFLSEKLEKKDFYDESTNISKRSKASKLKEKDLKISIKVAKYFLALYFLNVSYFLIFPIEREDVSWGGFIIKPFFAVIMFSIVFGIPYGIYRKIKYGRFFQKDKRIFFTKIFKSSFIVLLVSTVWLFIFSWLIGTL